MMNYRVLDDLSIISAATSVESLKVAAAYGIQRKIYSHIRIINFFLMSLQK
jgi:hypothetical protein